jgi:hypothetical protein
MRRIVPDRMREFRNDISILFVARDLRIPTAARGPRAAIRCPQCSSLHAAVNERTNLVRCFRCRRNYNPIDLVMSELRISFLDAVAYLERIGRRMESEQLTAPEPPRRPSKPTNPQ